jgi:serine/threonine-protein kinase
MNKNDQIEFLRKKSYIFQEDIGQGGTGKTILIKDELLDEVFVCKKYSPFYPEDKETYFKYFIDEIKLLHKVYHKNIVRVFNYYLYPEQVTGYILMEFIKGQKIDEYISTNPDKLNDLFVQTIEGFAYLEENKILHRDIRPENILVTNDGVSKIIDFGFGKTIDFDNSDNSISLNWRYSKPDEFSKKIYDTKTEIYFVGKLFEEIIVQFDSIDFKYLSSISKMVSLYSERTSSFFDIYREVINQLKTKIDFSILEVHTYREFADNLISLISKIPYGTKYKREVEQIIKSLEEVYKNSLLEEFIQNNNKLTTIFLDGQYSYFPKKHFKVEALSSMIKLLKSSSDDRRKVILNNLWERFDSIERYYLETNDDLPF